MAARTWSKNGSNVAFRATQASAAVGPREHGGVDLQGCGAARHIELRRFSARVMGHGGMLVVALLALCTGGAAQCNFVATPGSPRTCFSTAPTPSGCYCFALCSVLGGCCSNFLSECIESITTSTTTITTVETSTSTVTSLTATTVQTTSSPTMSPTIPPTQWPTMGPTILITSMPTEPVSTEPTIAPTPSLPSSPPTDWGSTTGAQLTMSTIPSSSSSDQPMAVAESSESSDGGSNQAVIVIICIVGLALAIAIIAMACWRRHTRFKHVKAITAAQMHQKSTTSSATEFDMISNALHSPAIGNITPPKCDAKGLTTIATSKSVPADSSCRTISGMNPQQETMPIAINDTKTTTDAALLTEMPGGSTATVAPEKSNSTPLLQMPVDSDDDDDDEWRTHKPKTIAKVLQTGTASFGHDRSMPDASYIASEESENDGDDRNFGFSEKDHASERAGSLVLASEEDDYLQVAGIESRGLTESVHSEKSSDGDFDTEEEDVEILVQDNGVAISRDLTVEIAHREKVTPVTKVSESISTAKGIAAAGKNSAVQGSGLSVIPLLEGVHSAEAQQQSLLLQSTMSSSNESDELMLSHSNTHEVEMNTSDSSDPSFVHVIAQRLSTYNGEDAIVGDFNDSDEVQAPSSNSKYSTTSPSSEGASTAQSAEVTVSPAFYPRSEIAIDTESPSSQSLTTSNTSERSRTRRSTRRKDRRSRKTKNKSGKSQVKLSIGSPSNFVHSGHVGLDNLYDANFNRDGGLAQTNDDTTASSPVLLKTISVEEAQKLHTMDGPKASVLHSGGDDNVDELIAVMESTDSKTELPEDILYSSKSSEDEDAEEEYAGFDDFYTFAPGVTYSESEAQDFTGFGSGLNEQPWYAGEIKRMDCEAAVLAASPGDYLVRTRGNKHFICINDRHVATTLVAQTDGDLEGSCTCMGHTFQSLLAAMDFLNRQSLVGKDGHLLHLKSPAGSHV